MPIIVVLLAEFTVFKGGLTILTVDNFAAPSRVILPSPTVTIKLLPLLTGIATPPETLSVEFDVKPLIMSLPSPEVYLIRTLSDSF